MHTSSETQAQYAVWVVSPEGWQIIKEGMRQNAEQFICSDPRSRPK
jgi:hypothetical protein